MSPKNTLLLALVLGGCAQTVRFPPSLWQEDGPDILIGNGRVDDASIDWGCVGEQDAWEGSLLVQGWASQAILHLTDDTRTERHDMSLVTSDERGEGFHIGPMTGGVPLSDQRAGSSSGFDCADTENEPSVVVFARDLDDNLTDCVWWGPSQAEAPDLVFADEVDWIGGCRRVWP